MAEPCEQSVPLLESSPSAASMASTMPSNSVPLLQSRPSSRPSTKSMLSTAPSMPSKKRKIWFGYLPVWSECVPLDTNTGGLDWSLFFVNVGAGMLMGMREALGAVVGATLIFSTSDNDELSDMLGWGISMVLFSYGMSLMWYAIFGRLQYGYGTPQDLIAVLQGQMALRICSILENKHESIKIPATVIATIGLSAVISGVCSIVMGKLGLGTFMLLFPTPVTSGFLGAIGFVILRASLQIASGVKFHWFYPTDMGAFLDPQCLAKCGCLLVMFCIVQTGPTMLKKCFAKSIMVEKLALLFCQLLPLLIFYVAVAIMGVTMEHLAKEEWTFKKQGSVRPFNLFSAYKMADVDWHVVVQMLPDMPALVVMAVLCTMLGTLTITDKFTTGPEGDPSPMESVDFNQELITVGASSALLGCVGCTLNFHKFSVIQLRLDGGTHRMAVVTVSLFVFGLFLSGVPIGYFVPKWFLGGLFLNTAVNFMKGTFLSYRILPKVDCMGRRLASPQYAISIVCILVAVFFSPIQAIGAGLILSIALFLGSSATATPINNVVTGSRVVGRSKRPFFETDTLMQQGDRIVLLYLQGQLFFGLAHQLAEAVAAAAASHRVEFCILSFARVTVVDPSAARHLKAAVERARRRGKEIIFCRMNKHVYRALKAADVISKPDPVLAKRVLDTTVCADVLGDKKPDAFTHETDALDYCDEHLITTYCYGDDRDPAKPKLEDYMLEYRKASSAPGDRLKEWAFDKLNELPCGFIKNLKDSCKVLELEATSQELDGVGNALCFILQGCVSVVQMLPEEDDLEVDFKPSLQSFKYRRGKRLIKRYPPGHVAGKQSFFLNPLKVSGHLASVPELKLFLSSKLGNRAEIWVLREEKFKNLPPNLKLPLTEMLCRQFADSQQHSWLQER